MRSFAAMNDQPQPNTSQERASLQVPAVMRRTAQTTQRISTALAAKIAWRWFLTPYPFKIPKRERPMEERFGAPEHFTHPRGLTYPVYTLGTGAKRVLSSTAGAVDSLNSLPCSTTAKLKTQIS